MTRSAIAPQAAWLDQLADIGRQPDDQVRLADAALILGALDQPEADLPSYHRHLAELVDHLAARALTADIADRCAALQHIFVEQFGYRGDQESYDDMQNANLLRVIDRRRGLPVSLGILYLHAARSLGWQIEGLNFPAHFLLRLSLDHRHVVIDPFHDARQLDAVGMRNLLKSLIGEKAELDPAYHMPVSDRAILVRLLNNITSRALQNDEPVRARDILERIRLIDPGNPSPWRDIAMVELRLGHLKLSIEALEFYLSLADQRGDSVGERAQITTLLQRLKKQLH